MSTKDRKIGRMNGRYLVPTEGGYQPLYQPLCQPPTSGSNAQKPIDKEAVWRTNLESFKAGAFGDPTAPKAIISYWEAQARAGYPHAIQNAWLWKSIYEKEDTK